MDRSVSLLRWTTDILRAWAVGARLEHDIPGGGVGVGRMSLLGGLSCIPATGSRELDR